MIQKTLHLKRGKLRLDVKVCFDETANVRQFCSKMADCIRADRVLDREQTIEAADAFGKSIIALYSLVFGKETTEAIENWYGDDVKMLIHDINPFILQTVLPAVKCAEKRNLKKEQKDLLKQIKRQVTRK